MVTVASHVAVTLARHIDHVFGIMGNGNAHFIDALIGSTPVPYTSVRHEAGAVISADVHYRTSLRLAAATVTYGAGFTNTLTALAESVQARTPLVLVAGDEPTWGRRPWDVDQIAMASAVGARTYTVGRVDAAAATVTAISHALTYQLPVVLAVPYDVATLDIGPVPDVPGPDVIPPMAPSPGFSQAALDRLAGELAAAGKPVLLAGRGAVLADSGAALGALASATGAVTMTTALARGIFPEGLYDVGIAGGFGAPEAMRLVRQADVVVAFGAGLNQFTMRFGDLVHPNTSLWQVDVAQTASHAQVGGFIRGDARLVAEALTGRLGRSGGSGWRERVELSNTQMQPVGEEFADDGRLDPRAVAAQIGLLLPDDRVVVSDGGHFIAWANMYWPVTAPHRMAMNGTAFQAIGTGWHSVAGAGAANPDSLIILTTGDGGGAMALSDMDTAVRTVAGRGMAVVFNDAAYGAEMNLYGLQGFATDPMLIPQIDFAGLADAAGGQGIRIHQLSDLAGLTAWLHKHSDERRFLVLDLRVSHTVIAPYQEEVIRANS